MSIKDNKYVRFAAVSFLIIILIYFCLIIGGALSCEKSGGKVLPEFGIPECVGVRVIDTCENLEDGRIYPVENVSAWVSAEWT